MDTLKPKERHGPLTVPEGLRGNWRVERFEIKASETWRYGARSAPAGTYTRLMHGRQLYMSDTPAEVLDHVPFTSLAKGHVLINGLGLGLCLKIILPRHNLKTVTVIERSPEVIALVGPTYTTDPRVEIVCADAFEYKPPEGVRYDAVWHDIWPDICIDNLPEITRLKRKYGRRCDWQGAWAEDLIRRAARNSRLR